MRISSIVHTGVQSIADCQQPMPCVVGLVQLLLAIGGPLLEIVEQVADRIRVPVQLLGRAACLAPRRKAGTPPASSR